MYVLTKLEISFVCPGGEEGRELEKGCGDGGPALPFGMSWPFLTY